MVGVSMGFKNPLHCQILRLEVSQDLIGRRGAGAPRLEVVIQYRVNDGGMARGIPEKATREVTITLYIDKTPFKEALAISTEDRIVTLIVARDGRVLWRADGRFSTASGAELSARLDTLAVRAP